MTMPAQYLFLKDCFAWLLKYMRKSRKNVSYLAALDFHEDGYAHYHVIFFHRVDIWMKASLDQLWESRNYGSKRYGLAWRQRADGEIQHLVRYLFKHSGKVFSGKDRPGWLRFHSVVHYMQNEDLCPGIRLFTMSSDIAKVMKLSEKTGSVLRVVDECRRVYSKSDVVSDNDAYEYVKKIEDYLDWYENLKI